MTPISRRGPDDEGWLQALEPIGPIILGFRRLSIYDLSHASNQPMTATHGAKRAHIVFNGAIYNHVALRAQLEHAGYQFSTRSDTEVLLAALDRWGLDALPRLDGMFAFALYDATERSLLVARDRFGEKPLFWRRGVGEGLAFFSDVRQAALAGSKPRIDHRSVGDFLNLGLVDHRLEETFYDDVRRVPPGCFAKIPLDRAVEPPEFKPWIGAHRSALPPGEPSEALRERMAASVALRLEADAPVGSCLSGGLDSSFIVGLANRDLARRSLPPLTTVSAVYDDAAEADGRSLSERPYVEAVRRAEGGKAHTVAPTPAEMLSAFDAVALAQGEPFAHSSICLQWWVFRQAKQAGLKVMLDGQGADELFGGYDPMVNYRLADRAAAGDIPELLRELRAWSFDRPWPGRLKSVGLELLSDPVLRALARARGKYPPRDWPVPSMLPERGAPRLGASRYEAMTRALVERVSLPALLRYLDRNAMDNGVEGRLPFLASSVADFGLALPAEQKMRDGWSKAVVRAAARGVVPTEVAERRRKLGFVTPQNQWLAGPWKTWALERVDAARVRFAPLLSAHAVDGIQRGVGSNARYNDFAFRLASLGTWGELFDVSV